MKQKWCLKRWRNQRNERTLHQSQNQTGLLTGYLLKQNISQINKSRNSLGSEGMSEVVVELENVPVRGSIRIIQYNLFEMKSLHLKQHLLALMVNQYLGIEKRMVFMVRRYLFNSLIKVVDFLIYVPVRDQKTLNKFASASAEGQ